MLCGRVEVSVPLPVRVTVCDISDLSVTFFLMSHVRDIHAICIRISPYGFTAMCEVRSILAGLGYAYGIPYSRL